MLGEWRDSGTCLGLAYMFQWQCTVLYICSESLGWAGGGGGGRGLLVAGLDEICSN